MEMGMGMTSWELEGMGTIKVIPAHFYCGPATNMLIRNPTL